jgi:hypothetical protein
MNFAGKRLTFKKNQTRFKAETKPQKLRSLDDVLNWVIRLFR